MLATVIIAHSHFYLFVHLLSTPAEPGAGLYSEDTAVRMTQGLLSGASSHPGPRVTPTGPCSPCYARSFSCNENCSLPPASPELPEQAPAPLGSDRSPSWHLKITWACGNLSKALGLRFPTCRRRRQAGCVLGVLLSVLWLPDL